jgi:hypothetical protein
LPRLVGSGLGGRLVGVSNRDQISHALSVLLMSVKFRISSAAEGQPRATHDG